MRLYLVFVQTTVFYGLLAVLVILFLVTMVKTSLLLKHVVVFSLGIALFIKDIVASTPPVVVSSSLGM
jgi:vacuolar-type H+-ATPase subunit I/STV1